MKPDRFEWAAFGALLALSFAVLAGLLVRVWTKGGVVAGADGFLVVDQLQYLNWLRQAGDHVAAENLYDCLRPGGYICLGHSESMSRISPLFGVRRFDDAIVYQRPMEGARG